MDQFDKIKEYCNKNNIKYKYEINDYAKTLTIESSANAYILIYKPINRPHRRTMINEFVDINQTFDYKKYAMSFVELIESLKYRRE